MNDETAIRVTKRSPVLLGVIVLCVVALGGAAAFVLYQRATEPPPASEVCGALARRLGAESLDSTGRGQELMSAIRAGYPWGVSAPPPGGLVEMVSNERVEYTPANVCRNNLYVWEHNSDRAEYGTLVRCLDEARDVAAVGECYDAAKQ